MISVGELVRRIPGKHKKIGGKNSFQCQCPAHRDKEASLTVSEGDKGKPVLHCHAGCSTGDILEALGLTMDDINGDRPANTWKNRLEWYMSEKADGKGYGPGVRIEAVYDYKDAAGRYLYSKIRFEGGRIQGKAIRYYTVDYAADTAKASKKKDRAAALYRLPEVIKAVSEGWPVYIVEGEKDVETLRGLKDKHRTATTAGSASDWRMDFAQYFTGARVILLPDNDPPGQDFADKVEKDLRQYAHSVTRVTVSDLEHGDVTDYLQKEGGTPELLEAKIKNAAPKYAPWIQETKAGIRINADLLAGTISRTVPFLVVKRPDDERTDFYLYSGGVYEGPKNKNEVKTLIRRYIPAGHASDSMLNNVYGLLLASGRNVCRYSDLDTDERYINFRNGLYNLQTGELEEHRPQVRSTLQLTTDYRDFRPDPEDGMTEEDRGRAGSRAAAAARPTFEKYISDLCRDAEGEPDPERLAILQEYFGLAISNIPVYRVKKCLVLVSRIGNTGKSVLLNLITDILGPEKVASIPITEMNEKNRFAMGGLLNTRLISVGDHSGGTVTDSAVFKQLTGGDPVKIEAKGKQAFFFRFRGGMAFACNDLPYFEDDRGGHIFERLQIIPCDHFIAARNRDPRILEKMQREKEAIAAFFLEGLQRLMANGYHFSTSSRSIETLKEYREKMDTVYRFISERYEETGGIKDLVSKADFDEEYTRWCTEGDNDYKAVKKGNLKDRLEAIGHPTTKGNVGNRRGIACYRGLKRKERENEEFMPVGSYEQEELPFS